MITNYTEEEKEIIKSVFCSSGEEKLKLVPKSIIKDTLRKFLDDCLEQDNELEWVFNGDRCRIIYQFVDESFIREYWDYITDWKKFWWWFNASEDFIKEAPVRDWYNISKYQKLSEDFIWENRDRVDWDKICERQILSKTFCYKHRQYINWDAVIECQDSYWKEELSDEIRKELYY